MNKSLLQVAVLVAACVATVGCGSNYNSNNAPHQSGLKFRAFVSNPLSPLGPTVNIVDASRDLLSPASIGLLGILPQTGFMTVTPDLRLTLLYSPPGDIAVINNATEAPQSATPTISLPGSSESIVVAHNNASAYVAVPAAPIAGESPGAVVAIDLISGGIQATIPVPAAHFLALSPDGSRLLVFSDNSNTVNIIATGLIGTNNDPRQPPVCCFDRPVWGIFADNSTAYVFNCGAECPGGVSAGVTSFEVNTQTPGPTTKVSGATYGIVSGGILYVAGTPPNTACPAGTAAISCGTLNMIDTSTMKLMNAQPIIVTDGYHNRMAMGANGQLFVGARSCTSINVIGGEVRGCLAIFNSASSKVIVPPQTGDATGIQPIAGRHIVYVCEGGAFTAFDTTTDLPLVQTPVPIDIVGFNIDVKVVDPPPAECTMDCVN